MSAKHLHARSGKTTTKRAPNGAGSVYQRKDGRWVAAVSLDGKQITRYAQTEREARTKLRELLHQRDRGMLRNTPQQSLSDYLADWLDHVAAHRVRPSTLWNYTSRLAHVSRLLGHKQLGVIKPADINRMYSTLIEEGHSNTSVRNIHVILSTALKDGVKHEVLDRNPAILADPPPLDPVHRNTLDLDTIRSLLAHVEGTEAYAMYALLLETGLRIGEAAALQWSDVDESALHVRHTVVCPKGKPYYLGPPKTASSERTVAISRDLRQILHAHKVLVLERKARSEQWGELDLVFPSEKGHILRPSVWDQRMRQHCKAAGIDHFSPHELRHTAGTLWLHGDGMPIRYAQERLGHGSSSITLDIYTHTDDAAHHVWAERASIVDRKNGK